MPHHQHPHLARHMHEGHPHHGPEWIVSVHEPAMARTEFADLLVSVAEALRDGSFEIGSTAISMPDTVEGSLRQERTPHGTLALVIRAEWAEHSGAEGRAAPLRGLVIKATPRTPGDRP